jgi:hypothetical protein
LSKKERNFLLNSSTPEWPVRPVDSDEPIEPSEIEEYTAALIRGHGQTPEKWFRARNPQGRAEEKAVAVLRCVDLLVRHRNELALPADQPGKVPDVAPGRVAHEPVMSAPSVPVAEPADALLWDRQWLAEHNLEPIGKLDVTGGGMGFIALAWHSGMKREVVLKVARRERDEDRFRREIQVHAKLGGHVNIAVTRTPLRYQQASVLVVDYVPGPSLKRLVELKGAVPWRESCDWIRQAAVGLGYAHRLGVTHRDIKPSNLVRSSRDGVVKVIDWGLALDRRAPIDDLTVRGQFLGTPHYCAPEQAKQPSDAFPASDLYGLGCVWYELLTGFPPFRGNHLELASAHEKNPVPALPEELGVPEEVELVLRKLLEKNPQRRFVSADEFIAALDHAVAARPIGRRHWFGVLVGGLVLGAFVIALRGGARRAHSSLSVRDLVIELSDTSANPSRSGRLGDTTYEARLGDQVTLRGELSDEAYCYLLSFRPDGQIDVWSPANVGQRPAPTTAPCYPDGDPTKVIELVNGTGLQAFALVVSRDSLPDFGTWRAQQSSPPWRAKVPADRGVVWRFDGARVETLKSARGDRNRGDGVAARGAYGAVVDLSDWLRSRPGVSAVYVKAFAVEPAQP